MPTLTHERLLELLTYDASTGVFKWRMNRGGTAKAGTVAGTVNVHGYVQIRLDGEFYYGHRLAIFFASGQWPINQVDHRFGIRSDNRLSELRDVTQRINNQNRRTANRLSKTGLLGASPTGDGKFVSHIGVDGRVKHLGRFDTAQEAHAAHIAAKRELHEGNTL